MLPQKMNIHVYCAITMLFTIQELTYIYIYIWVMVDWDFRISDLVKNPDGPDI